MINKLMLGLLTVTALGNLMLPAHADLVNVQDSTQVVTQEGDGNTSFQESSQTIRVRRSGPSQENEGNVQGSYQDTLQQGNDNYSDTVNEQNIRTRSRNR
jgi:hypothetical protein